MGGGPEDFRRCAVAPARSGQKNNSTLWGIVDMGSNGIRFSISDLAEPTARILPTLYSYRNGISLYEAQYDEDGNQVPIPEDVIQAIIGALLRFEIFCTDFGVPFSHVRVIATEATRAAKNSVEFRKRILEETGLKVELLSHSEEGLTGAWGIASSASQVRGLVMDLGGGSTQITWMITDTGKMQTSPKGAFSFPYGAAALTQRLAAIEKDKSPEEIELAKKELRLEMEKNFLQAYHDLEVPDELVDEAENEGGFPLYLSGGGFRGWGYLLLYESQKHGHDYPISIINGFTVDKKEFEDTEHLKQVAKRANRIFRVSDRRREQVPAVAFLVNVLARIIPHGIRQAHFCQGGVREGALFRTLSPQVRMQSPIEVATAPYARPLCKKLAKLLNYAMPEEPTPTKLLPEDRKNGWDIIENPSDVRKIPLSLSTHLLHALANVMYIHSNMTKELASTAALYTTSTGLLADAHGTSHINRALLALMLEARYEGDLPPREEKYKMNLRRILSPSEIWWCNYLGAVALVLSRIFPAGSADDLDSVDAKPGRDHDDDDEKCTKPGNCDGFNSHRLRPHHIKPKVKVYSEFSDELGEEKNKSGIKLTFVLKMRGTHSDDPMKVEDALKDHVKEIAKVGKKKRWIKRADLEDVDFDGWDEESGEPIDADPGWGMKVEVDVKVQYKHKQANP